jgi:hypothetical protein
MRDDFGAILRKTPGKQIKLIDHYMESAEDCAKVLEGLDNYLGEYEERIFPCTCEDGDEPKGSMDYEVNAYTHHRDCPQGTYYHYHVFLAGIARYLREEVQS